MAEDLTRDPFGGEDQQAKPPRLQHPPGRGRGRRRLAGGAGPTRLPSPEAERLTLDAEVA